MPKKNTIYIVIVVVAFAATGFLVYKSISGPSSPAPIDTGIASEAQVPAQFINILPLGNKFDTAPVKKLNTQFNIFNYPQVLPGSIGVSTSDLIKGPAEAPAK